MPGKLIGRAFTGGESPSDFWQRPDGSVYKTGPAGSFVGDAYDSISDALRDWGNLEYRAKYPGVVALLLALEPFRVGDRVIHTAFTDCFGKHHPDTETLRVEKVTLIAPDTNVGVKPYWRVLASNGEPYRYWEGAASGFRLVEGEEHA